jgi:hypothetical protein
MLSESLQCRLAGQLDGLDWVSAPEAAGRIDRRPAPDQWSAREHLAHLACYHQRSLERLRAILATNRPVFHRYRAEDDPDWPAWQRLTAAESLERMRGLRRELIGWVGSRSDSELGRVGVHPVFGELTVAHWLEFFLVHEAHHLYTVMSLAWRHPPEPSSGR